MQTLLQIPSRIQPVNHHVFNEAGILVFVKRDDEIHPAISGNKWRKLTYNLQAIAASGRKGFVTFGGAFSNHLAAAAYAGFLNNMQMVGVVRGEEADLKNPTLSFAKQCGMHIIRVTRSEYSKKNEPDFLAELQRKFPDLEIIPEGGSNILGVKGCMEILSESQRNFDFVACTIGTATTFSGLLLSAPAHTHLLGFPAIKGGHYLRADVHNFIAQAKTTGLVASTFTEAKWSLQTDFHFGGFGKINAELVQFMNNFYAETAIPLDPIYTAKLFFGLVEMAKAGKFEKGTKILAIHTGGLQGIKGMNQRLKNKGFRIDYEEITGAAYPYSRA